MQACGEAMMEGSVGGNRLREADQCGVVGMDGGGVKGLRVGGGGD